MLQYIENEYFIIKTSSCAIDYDGMSVCVFNLNKSIHITYYKPSNYILYYEVFI